LEFVAFAKKPVTREQRALHTEQTLESELTEEQSMFIKFVLDQYEKEGIIALDDDNLPTLLELQYDTLQNAKTKLGELVDIRDLFINFQSSLYDFEPVAG
jgi:type I restriction enzyme R subunit